MGWNCTGYIHEIFKPSLCRYSTRSQITLYVGENSAENNHRAKEFILLRAKNMVEDKSNSAKSVKTTASFIHALKNNLL